MSEERLNPFFDFNAKIEATIKDAKNIIEKHKEDNSCEPQDFVCLAYDTINCLNQLQQENKELKETIKADEKANLILANDNKMLRRSKKNAYQEFKKKHNSLYKQKIDKAIEYIKLINNDYDTLYSQDIELLSNYLLKILEGDK